MYSIDSVIEDVKNYLLYKNQIIVLCKDGRILLDGVELSDFGTDLEIWHEFLVYNNRENHAVFLNLESKELFVSYNISSVNTNSLHGMKFGVNSAEKLVNFEVENDGLKIIELDLQYNWEMIETRSFDSYFLWDGNSVKFINSGKMLWQKYFSEIGTIRKLIVQSEEFVWLTIAEKASDSRKTSIVALDPATGELRKSISSNLFPIHPVHIEFLKDQLTILSAWGKISANTKAESPIFELNAKTGEVYRNTYSQQLFEANLKLGSWKYLDGKIYFDAALDTINSTYVGVMNYQTLELEWYEEVKDRKAGLRNLNVDNRRIYVMDSGNQLFVYKKE